jgi:hypothetical protein
VSAENRPFLSVCIPAYNRAAVLPAVLDSVLAQDFTDWECVVAEDRSRERDAIRAVVERYAAAHPGKFRLHLNPENLGYDGNFRNLVALARGRYVFMLGNDDFVAAGAFRALHEGITRHGEVGAVLKAYTFFEGEPTNTVQVNRYYASERVFAPGRAAILACYRRFVGVSGVTLHRDAALAIATERWDGTLFYQQWLAGCLLAEKPLLYLPTILAHFRRGGTPEFGNAAAERGRFTPGVQPLDTQVKLIEGLFAVADGVEEATGLRGLANEIRADFGRYSYHTLRVFAGRGLWPAYRAFGRVGFDRSPWFHLWMLMLSVLGVRAMEGMFNAVRRVVGHTPNLTRAAR